MFQCSRVTHLRCIFCFMMSQRKGRKRKATASTADGSTDILTPSIAITRRKSTAERAVEVVPAAADPDFVSSSGASPSTSAAVPMYENWSAAHRAEWCLSRKSARAAASLLVLRVVSLANRSKAKAGLLFKKRAAAADALQQAFGAQASGAIYLDQRDDPADPSLLEHILTDLQTPVPFVPLPLLPSVLSCLEQYGFHCLSDQCDFRAVITPLADCLMRVPTDAAADFLLAAFRVLIARGQVAPECTQAAWPAALQSLQGEPACDGVRIRAVQKEMRTVLRALRPMREKNEASTRVARDDFPTY